MEYSDIKSVSLSAVVTTAAALLLLPSTEAGRFELTGIFASTELMIDLTVLEDDIMRQMGDLHREAQQATDALKMYIDEWLKSKPQTTSMEETLIDHRSHDDGNRSLNSLEKNSANNNRHSQSAEVGSKIFKEMRSLDQKSQLHNTSLPLRKRLASTDPGVDYHPIHHPINAYNLIKRRTFKHNSVVNKLNHLVKSIKATVASVQVDEEDLLPTPDDLRVAAATLVNMQKMYQLDISRMMQGDVQHEQLVKVASSGVTASTLPNLLNSHNKLELWDALFLGKHAGIMGFRDIEQSWLRQATRMIDDVGQQLPEDMTSMAAKLDIVRQNSTDAAPWMETQPFPDDHKKFNRVMSEEEQNYFQNQLCAGHQVRSPEDEAPLQCRLTTQQSPYLLLMPIKMEVLSISPPVMLYHDFLSHDQTVYFMKRAKEDLEFSEVNHNIKGHFATMDRTSVSTFVGKYEDKGNKDAPLDPNPEEDEDPFLTTLSKRIEQAIGGLKVASTKASEAYQVVNYGIGGHYNIHADYGIPGRRNGERLVTFLMYLTNVAAGGGTVFPRLGVGVQPEKGMALVWYNLRPNGTPDSLMLHAACPVLHGNKWISTKWVLYFEQFQRSPCPLHRYQKNSL